MKNRFRWLVFSLIRLGGRAQIALFFWGQRHGRDLPVTFGRDSTILLFSNDLESWGQGRDWPGEWWSLYCRARVHLLRHPEGCVSCKLDTGMWPTRTGIMGQVRHTWKHLG